MPLKILAVSDSMIREARLPYRQLRLQAKRKTSLDELDSPLQRCLRCRRDQRVNVVGHDHEIMKKIFPLAAVMLEDVNEQISGGGALEYGSTLCGDGGDEKRAIHLRIVVLEPRRECDVNHATIVQFCRRRQRSWWKSRPLGRR